MPNTTDANKANRIALLKWELKDTAAKLGTGAGMFAGAACVALFGLGSTLGMAALSGLLGWPLARLGQHRGVARAVSLVVGCVSTTLGIYWGYPLIGRLF